MSDHLVRLLSTMTLDEKLGQLTMVGVGAPHFITEGIKQQIRDGRIGSVLHCYGADDTEALQRLAVEESRLRIPLFFGLDVLHGHRTIFPIPLAEAGCFDPDLWERTARAAAAEAAADGISFNFAPGLDVCRDPRWGRIAESPGEDSFVACRYGAAKIRGFQGDDLTSPTRIAATAKHIGAYGAVAAGREYAPVDVSERQLAEVYLPPFEAAVRAGVAAIMPSQNDLAGVPMCAHGSILTNILRERWNFSGVVISDFESILELIKHGVAEDVTEAVALALKAGVDIDMHSQTYLRALPTALERGLVTMDDIDRAALRVLALKARLGLFENPFGGATEPRSLQLEKDCAVLARDAARRSVVLLKNEGATLPLTQSVKRIALIGPLAEAPLEMFGPWFAAAGFESITIRAGLCAALPDADIDYVEGVSIDGRDDAGIAAAVEAARTSDVVILSLGEAKTMSGEAASRGRIDLPGCQRALAEAILVLKRPTVVVLSHGRPLVLPWLFERADAVLATWFLGSEAGHGIADVLTGAWNPSARLAVSWPADVGQIPVFHGQRNTGRPYRPNEHYSSRFIDVPNEPQFPFGYGLSYTRFAVRRLAATPAEFSADQTVTVAAEIANEGDANGEETIFLFLRDPVATVARPVLELKGFAKVTLAPGEHKTIRFTITANDLAFLDQDLKPRTEAGTFEILVGPNADRNQLTATAIRLIRS